MPYAPEEITLDGETLYSLYNFCAKKNVSYHAARHAVDRKEIPRLLYQGVTFVRAGDFERWQESSQAARTPFKPSTSKPRDYDKLNENYNHPSRRPKEVREQCEREDRYRENAQRLIRELQAAGFRVGVRRVQHGQGLGIVPQARFVEGYVAFSVR